MLSIAIVVVALVLVASNLRQRGRRPEHWSESLLSALSTLMIGLFLLTREVGPSGQTGDVLQAALLAAAVLLRVRATLERRRRLRRDEGEPRA